MVNSSRVSPQACLLHRRRLPPTRSAISRRPHPALQPHCRQQFDETQAPHASVACGEPGCSHTPSHGTGARPSLVRTRVKSVPAGASVHCCPARRKARAAASLRHGPRPTHHAPRTPHHAPRTPHHAPVPDKDDPRRPNLKRHLGPVHGRTLRCPTLRTSVQVFTCSVHLCSQKSPRLRSENTGFC
jgi:hypothetical protein